MKLLTLVFLWISIFSAEAVEGNFLLGSRYFGSITDNDTYLTSLYFEQNIAQDDIFSTKVGAVDLLTNLRAEYYLDSGESQIDFVEAYLSYQSDNFVLKMGAQQFAFSETFGVNLMDILNPRDYSLSIFQNEKFYRLSSWAISYKYLSDNFNFELIWIPVARSDRFTSRSSPYAIYPSTIKQVESLSYRSLHDGEGAVRLQYLSAGGLDTSVMLALHHNRMPTFYYQGSTALALDEHVVGVGLSFTYAWESLVMRSDTLWTRDDPFNLITGTIYREANHWQNISGIDWSGESGLRLAMQLHYNSQSISLQPQYWASGLIAYYFADDLCSTELMIFHGIDNDDLWIKPSLQFYWNNWQLLIVTDILRGTMSEGALGFYDHIEQWRLELDYLF